MAAAGGVTGELRLQTLRRSFCSCLRPAEGRPKLDPGPHSRAWGTLKGQWGAVMADPTGAQVQGGTLTSGVWEHKGGRAPEPPGWLSGWASRYVPHSGARVPTLAPGVPTLHPRAWERVAGWEGGKLEGLVTMDSQSLI